MECIAGVENLRLKFPGGKSLQFRDLSLSFNRGEKVLLLGPSGCGKSTLLQVLTGLIPNSVEVPLKYEKIRIPGSWGFVFQDPDTQFCMPFVDEEMAFVLENLGVPREEMPARITGYLNQVGLNFAHPHVNIQTLSQGMKQRLAIASVLALEPEVMFLDEPTALLDPEGTKQVWKTLKTVGEEKTLIIVEHKIDEIVDFVDRVVLFNHQGQVVADGDKEHIFNKYKSELKEYGIWYPGVWDDYTASSRYRKLKHNVRDNYAFPVAASPSQPLAVIRDFMGYRGKEAKITISAQDIYPGEWIAVVGENGAGKSTLLLSLMQLIKTKGDYLIKGTPVEKIKNLSAHLAFVFQNPEFQFVTNSVFEEIAYTLRLEGCGEALIKEKATDLLSFFELEDKQDQHPYQLSMGQKRRLSVAAGIVKEQDILLLDEPTFGQDAKNTFAILEKLEQWRRRGTTIIMVTHDNHIVQHFATRVWLVEQGMLAADTIPDQYLPHYQEELSCI